MVPCRFEVKMLYLAIRVHRFSILSVTTFTAKNNYLFGKFVSVQHV